MAKRLLLAGLSSESALKARSVVALTILGALAFAVTSQKASADSLHGYCGTGPTTTCVDNGTNSPTSSNPPTFLFADSGGSASGDLWIVFLVPSTATQPGSIALTGSVSGTASLVTGGPWNSGSLDTFLGISANPNNPIGAYLAGGSSYDVYVANLGQETISGTGSPFSSPLEETSSALPLDSYILGFLNTGTASDPSWTATANSGAILEDGTPPPVPEPSSLALLGTGVLGAAGVLRRKFRRS